MQEGIQVLDGDRFEFAGLAVAVGSRDIEGHIEA